MRRYIYIIVSVALLFIAVGCHKEGDEDSTYRSETIHFAGGEVTKAFLEQNGIEKTGTQVKVYDFLTGFDGTINGVTVTPSDRVKYVDEVIEYNESSTNKWPFLIVAHEYRWTRSGTHRFFGWLHKDRPFTPGLVPADEKTTESFFGSSPVLNESTLVMTTPSYTWTKNSPQYDFVFSKQAVLRNAASGDYSDVILPMKHLFTAVSITLENMSTSTAIEVTGLSTVYQGEDLLLHSGYATVDFSVNGELTPTYTLTGDAEHPLFDASAMSGITVGVGQKYDLLSGTNLTTSGSPTFYLTWPLTLGQVSPGPSGEDIFGDKYYLESEKILALSYSANGRPSETVRIPFPQKAWRAGTKMHMNIEFTDKAISIVAETLPWDYNEQEMSFNGESLVVPDGGKLVIEGMSSLQDNAKVYLTTENPELTCKLSISSLKGSTLVIKKIGADPAYFTLDPASLTITGGQLSFKIRGSSLPTGGVERTCKLSFSVELPDGREIDGDSEILGNDHNYIYSRQ